MVAQREAEQVGEVEQHDREREVGGREDRVGHDLAPRGVHEPQDPLAGSAGAVPARLERLEHHRDGRTGDQEQRHDHGQRHVLHHVGGEQHAGVDGHAAARGVEQCREAHEPGRGAQRGPRVTAAPHLHGRPQVDHREERHHGHPEPVPAPQREPVAQRGFRGKLVPREDARGRGVGFQLLRDRRSRTAQGGGDAHEKPHEHHLHHDHAPQGGRAGPGAVRHAGDQPLPVREPGRGQQHGEAQLAQRDHPVGRRQLIPGADPHRGVDDPREQHEHVAAQRHGGVPAQHHREQRLAVGAVTAAAHHAGLPGEQRAHPDQHDEPAHPQAHAQQVQTEGVDRTHVVRAPGRVAGERQGHEGHEGQREGAEQPQQRAHPEHQGGDHRGNHHDHGLGLARGQPGDVVQQLLGVALTAPEARAGDVRVREHEHRHSGHRPHHGGGLHEPQHLPVDRVLRLPRLVPAVARGPLARGVREARHHSDGEQQPAHDHGHRDVVHGLHHGQAPPHERPGVRDLPGCGRAAEHQRGRHPDHRGHQDHRDGPRAHADTPVLRGCRRALPGRGRAPAPCGGAHPGAPQAFRPIAAVLPGRGAPGLVLGAVRLT